jgi:hypothetical protein
MAAHVDKKSETDRKESGLSERDARLLLTMSTELLSLCARLSGKIDPAAAAMLTYVRDDILSESTILNCNKFDGSASCAHLT